MKYHDVKDAFDRAVRELNEVLDDEFSTKREIHEAQDELERRRTELRSVMNKSFC